MAQEAIKRVNHSWLTMLTAPHKSSIITASIRIMLDCELDVIETDNLEDSSSSVVDADRHLLSK